MQAVVGVARRSTDANRIVESLRELGISDFRLSILAPASSESVLGAIPTTEAEQPGIGGTIGSVVGGAAGTAGGLAVASLALPGVGLVIAAGAIALGVVGAVAGGAIGGQLDDTLSKGLPTDELYVYRHALRTGRSLVVVTVADDAEASRVRELMADLGAESVDAAREEWWIGLRDAEEAEYTRQGGDFGKDEALYRLGFDAAFRLPGEAPLFEQARRILRDRHGPSAEASAFRTGYERGRAHRATHDEGAGCHQPAEDRDEGPGVPEAHGRRGPR
ncbi:MAG TPA: hypothetical protein VHF87_09540 [Methylomirabilota bacterium]|jgi:hypothetical protein|nr:hypothetical protein [Methylomirabilota bacterium]